MYQNKQTNKYKTLTSEEVLAMLPVEAAEAGAKAGVRSQTKQEINIKSVQLLLNL